MRAKLPALEKNILKYRALQMVLLLHEVESLRSFLIGSIRKTDSLPWRTGTERLPAGTRGPMQKALDLLVSEAILTEAESKDLQAIVELRNKVGHAVHELVEDISAPPDLRTGARYYDYGALERFERYRRKIERGMMGNFVMQVDFRVVAFEHAEATYREELARLRKRIDRQYAQRSDTAA
ncbi:hypothetical protein [Ideonella alba]|uniref:Uncharacterized protein n=1 Tax=Ideonella alba TaxID=2824118 RepID=A0A940YPW5_9BURK|nr:hypothetical protein [Ideonella alba]MBQ0933674.1 hypothetical protein [Ideonella alba]